MVAITKSAFCKVNRTSVLPGRRYDVDSAETSASRHNGQMSFLMPGEVVLASPPAIVWNKNKEES